MTKENFIEMWEMLPDKKRVKFLRQQAKENFDPKFELTIDNDSVFLTFNDEEDYDERTILSFDEFGYHLLVDVFNAVGIPADFC